MRERDRERLRVGASGGEAAWLNLVLFPLALFAVGFLLLYLPIGLIAVASLDGLNASMHAGLGQEAPLPQRLFEGLQRQLWLWPAGLVAAWGHVALRRLVRRGSSFGDSVPWDALGSPLLSGSAAGAVAMLVRASRSPGRIEDVVLPGLLAAGLAFVALGLAGLCLSLLRRHRALRLAVVVVLVAAFGLRLGAEAWSRLALERYRSQRAPELAALDARRAARERPLVSGPAIDEDGWPRYRKLIDALRTDVEGAPSLRDLAGLGDLEPFAAIPPKAKAVLESRRAEVAAMREATRCRRCVPEVFTNPTAPVPSLLGVRYLALLAGLEGNERAGSGDLDGAAQRYLEIVRFGGDIGDGNLIHGLLGIALEERGLRALGRLVHSGRCSAAVVDRSERTLAELERQRASLTASLENERRVLGWLGDALDAPLPGSAPILPLVVPYRALAAHAQRVADPLSRRFQEALAKDDLEAWRRVRTESDAVAGSSWNPFLRLVMGYSGIDHGGSYGERLFLTARRQLAHFRLVEAALLLEREKRAHGRYPSGADAVELPKDPFAPQQPLHYRVEGSSYVLWSVGLNGVDDGGQSDRDTDIVL